MPTPRSASALLQGPKPPFLTRIVHFRGASPGKPVLQPAGTEEEGAQVPLPAWHGEEGRGAGVGARNLVVGTAPGPGWAGTRPATPEGRQTSAVAPSPRAPEPRRTSTARIFSHHGTRGKKAAAASRNWREKGMTHLQTGVEGMPLQAKLGIVGRSGTNWHAGSTW